MGGYIRNSHFFDFLFGMSTIIKKRSAIGTFSASLFLVVGMTHNYGKTTSKQDQRLWISSFERANAFAVHKSYESCLKK